MPDRAPSVDAIVHALFPVDSPGPLLVPQAQLDAVLVEDPASEPARSMTAGRRAMAERVRALINEENPDA